MYCKDDQVCRCCSAASVCCRRPQARCPTSTVDVSAARPESTPHELLLPSPRREPVESTESLHAISTRIRVFNSKSICDQITCCASASHMLRGSRAVSRKRPPLSALSLDVDVLRALNSESRAVQPANYRSPTTEPDHMQCKIQYSHTECVPHPRA